MGIDKFVWHEGDLTILHHCEVALVIDGELHPWYRADWDPGNVDAVAVFQDEMTGAPRFNPSDRAPSGEPGEVEQAMLREVGMRGIALDPLTPVPDGLATELRLTGMVELTIPLA